MALSKIVHVVNKCTPEIIFGVNLIAHELFREADAFRDGLLQGSDHIFLFTLPKCCIISSSDRTPLPQPRRHPVL